MTTRYRCPKTKAHVENWTCLDGPWHDNNRYFYGGGVTVGAPLMIIGGWADPGDLVIIPERFTQDLVSVRLYLKPN